MPKHKFPKLIKPIPANEEKQIPPKDQDVTKQIKKIAKETLADIKAENQKVDKKLLDRQ